MIEDEQARKKAARRRRLRQRVERLSVWIERKSNVLGRVVRAFQAWAWWDFRHNVSHSVLGLIALAMIGGGHLV